MNTRILVLCALLGLSLSIHAETQAGARANTSAAATASADPQQANASVASGTEVSATLAKPLDAGRNKPGDEVTAKVTQDIKANGQIVIPRGSKLIGHVTQAQAHTKGATSAGASAASTTQSELGILFDRAVLKDGREILLNATVQAVAASAAAVGASDMDSRVPTGAASSSSQAGGGLIGGVSGTATSTVGTVANVSGAAGSTVGGTARVLSKSHGAVGGVSTAGHLTAGSKGVFGLDGLDITASGAASAQGYVITSTNRNVRLESGTRLLLVTSGKP